MMLDTTEKMRVLLVTVCLFGLATSENSTIDDVTTFTSTGLHPETEAIGQNVAWREQSPWTRWSRCSRRCGGGISHQERRCRGKECKENAWTFRYKVCNIVACEPPSDFRAEQCAAFDSVPYRGQLFKWYPHHDRTRACSLICRGVPTVNDRTRTNDFRRTRKLHRDSESIDNGGLVGDHDGVTNDSEDEDNFSRELDTEDDIVVQLAARVEDGTKCHQDTTDVCVAGTCSKVGCDMRVGSNKNKDSCGVCGGNGSSCQPQYSWSLESISACSKSCGSGFKMAMPVCKSLDDGVVEDSNCDPDARPNKTLLPCNVHPCSTKWITGEWSRCSASCGGGSRTRPIFCTEENGNETTKLPEHRCNAIYKPGYQETCNTVSCPMWESSPWSQCSVTCGNGVRTRTIECRDAEGRASSDCDATERPRDEQECKTNEPCVNYSDEMNNQPLGQPYPPPPVPEKLIDQKVPAESTFIADEWSSCSVTCGEGIRHREVHCKIFLEFSRTIATLPDKQCAGPKPPETEKCTAEACTPLDNSLSYRIDTVGDSGYEESNLMDSYRSSSGSGLSSYESDVKVAPGSSVRTTYSWKEAGYTSCTATCLGGVQDLIINCVRDDDNKVVMPLLCTKETKPESRIRTCNDHPCPPRWNFSEFSPCRSPCGIGIQTRDVTCIHEVARGPGNTVVVPNQMCKPPPPADRQHCNVLDCPPKWQPTEWSRCSKSCGGGTKRRKVSCEQVMAQGHILYKSDRDCPGTKPPMEKPCNTRSCHDVNLLLGVQPTILTVNMTFIQRDIEQKVDLKIGGSATVYPGTGVVKIRCPVKKFKRNQIEWTKNGVELTKSKKYKISRKGALRIMDITYTDDGTYACIAGQSHAETRLIVNNRPREQMSSEEILRSGNTLHHRQSVKLHSSPVNSGENLQIDRAAPGYQGSFTFGNDDLSHEARPDIPTSGKPTKKPRNRKKPKPSAGPLDSSMAQGEYSVTSVNQPGYQESVESTASSGGSQLKPHLSQLISSLKAYWPFQGDSSNRGHRMAPPMLLDDSMRSSPNDETQEASENDLRYDSREPNLRVFSDETIIPDDSFGPDEERIFIDDDPYDLDAAFFAIHRENAPIMSEDKKLKDFVSPRKEPETKTPQGTDKDLDYIEQSLIKTKLQDRRIIDNYLRNQRGTGRSEYENNEKSHEPVEFNEKNDRATTQNFGYDHRSNGKSNFSGKPESAEKTIYEKLSDLGKKPEESTTVQTTEKIRESTQNRQDNKDAEKASTIEASKNLVGSTTTVLPNEVVKREGFYGSQLSLESIEGDESYDGELSKEMKATSNGTSRENRGFSKNRNDYGTEANETAKDDSSAGGEITRDDELLENEEKSIHSKDNSKFTVRDKNSEEPDPGTASLAFENKESSNESAIGGFMNIYSYGTADNLTFEWITTDWSKCSQTCGGGGFQMRGAQCTVRPTHQSSNATRVISRTVIGASLCEDAGFPVPQKVRACGAGRCPQWHAGDWTPCESSRCFNWKTAMQRREISCRLPGDTEDESQNITLLDAKQCDDGIRPPQRQECYNDACKGVWRVGEWSECTASCEEDGIKYRILQCVWFGTKKPAGNACRDLPRPPVMKTCRGQPCHHASEECKDQSQLCSTVMLMNMCRVPLYQKQCCETCR
ncbi:protein madd-4 [Venturia canescens]|uniref:protein madd-4 n=1 Tax=Venturia canescens TaxID=32260 RepID=UPI001C9BE4C3|nr:protein madd-4 [Venturia canescens]